MSSSSPLQASGIFSGSFFKSRPFSDIHLIPFAELLQQPPVLEKVTHVSAPSLISSSDQKDAEIEQLRRKLAQMETSQSTQTKLPVSSATASSITISHDLDEKQRETTTRK